MLASLVKSTFNKFGFRISRVQEELSMEGALKRCISRGLNVNSIIDVGASDGRWSESCMDFLPNANYLLIEAQDAHRSSLEKFKSRHRNADFVIAAAGAREGTLFFDNSDLLGGLASDTPFDKNCIEVPVVTIDQEIKNRKLKGPYLIKLDTHGFEVPILEGATDALKNAELVIIETYNYKLTDDSLKYYEMCEYMEKIGFSSIEVVDFMLRKHDASFWQMDTFFIPTARKEFNHNSFL